MTYQGREWRFKNEPRSFGLAMPARRTQAAKTDDVEDVEPEPTSKRRGRRKGRTR